MVVRPVRRPPSAVSSELQNVRRAAVAQRNIAQGTPSCDVIRRRGSDLGSLIHDSANDPCRTASQWIASCDSPHAGRHRVLVLWHSARSLPHRQPCRQPRAIACFNLGVASKSESVSGQTLCGTESDLCMRTLGLTSECGLHQDLRYRTTRFCSPVIARDASVQLRCIPDHSVARPLTDPGLRGR